MYAFSENYVLPLSHDEVVHGKGSLLAKMPGDRAQKLANVRVLYGYMWAHPGKKLLFMGDELAQEREWDAEGSVDWHLLEHPEHAGVQRLVGDLNRLYRAEPALHEVDSDPEGFRWLELHDADANVLAFARFPRTGRPLACVCNLSSAPRPGYRVALPRPGIWREVLNTDAVEYGGSGIGNLGRIVADETPWHDQPYSGEVTLPALGGRLARPRGRWSSPWPGQALPARADVGRTRHELLALLRERRAGRALLVRRRGPRDAARRCRSARPSTGTATSPM